MLQPAQISSGMSGDLGCIATVALLQLMKSTQKNGNIDIQRTKGKTQIYFKVGEIVYSQSLLSHSWLHNNN